MELEKQKNKSYGKGSVVCDLDEELNTKVMRRAGGSKWKRADVLREGVRRMDEMDRMILVIEDLKTEIQALKKEGFSTSTQRPQSRSEIEEEIKKKNAENAAKKTQTLTKKEKQQRGKDQREQMKRQQDRFDLNNVLRDAFKKQKQKGKIRE